MVDTKRDTRLPLVPLSDFVCFPRTALRKLELLTAALPERALSVLSILKARQRVLDLLRPYRPLAAQPDLN